MPAVMPRTALAVFDTPGARDFACQMLRAAGVAEVTTGDRDGSLSADVILTDWPPGGDIGAHVRALRCSNGDRRDAPVVVLTARDARADLHVARAAGVDAYVVKPVSPALLKTRLAKLASNAPGR
jgi:CheY-like chemotaxis protein